MRLAADLLGLLFGGWLRVVTVPVLILSTLTLGKELWERRDARLLAQGEMVCRVDWERRAREDERAAAAERVRQMEAALAAEREAIGGLQDELTRIRAEAEALRTQAAGADERCLSPGVLDALARSARETAGRPAGREGPRRR
jgi:hypothetical protein